MTIPSPRASRRARIEIIPLIDIIFFLLATFVMVSLSMVKNRGMPVNLPAAQSTAAQPLPDHATVSITRDGMLFLDKEPVDEADLPNRLAALAVEKHGDAQVLIRGDEEAKLGKALEVLDACRRQGIAKVIFQTRPKEP